MIALSKRPCDKARFAAALRREPCAEVSYFETELSPGVAGRILGKRVSTRSYLLDPDDYVNLMRLCGIDVMYVHVPHSPGRKEITAPDGRRIQVDGAIKAQDDLKLYVNQDTDPVKRRVEALLSAARDTGIGWCYAFGGTSTIAPQMGYTHYYTQLYEDPRFIHEFIKRQEASLLPVMEAVLSYKPDAVFLNTDICYKTGLAMNMDMAEEFVLGCLRRQAKLAINAGVPVILHSDGDNSALMEKWIDMGVAALHPMEGCDGFDIFDAKQKWGGRICLMGNIDVPLLADGTPQQVRGDTLRHLEALSPGGGYICGSSHDIDDNVNIDNLRAMVGAVTAFRARQA